ncbi:MAG TPA: DUF2442 domain-containing protein [Chlamydiales bacterium]|nr:DUF2442 domain-containing protein [Chlamydiales bacterium]
MNTLKIEADERAEGVHFTRDMIVVDLADGRTISVPLAWYPRLLNATPKQRAHWKICGGGYGIHWPEIDEDLSTEGFLRGYPAPNARRLKSVKKKKPPQVRRSRPKAKSRSR